MNDIPQIIVAALALLIVFLLGCIIGWLLRSKIFKKTRTAQVAKTKEFSTDNKNIAEKSEPVAPKPTTSPAPNNKQQSKIDPAADKPIALSAPRNNKKDDLKKISGIGPKIEGLLNGLGIFHFDQISSWTPEQVEWVDDYLSFKGRIERDGWIKQAKDLL